MTSFSRIILASASPRRVELLRQLVPDFDVIPSQVEETPNNQLTACELALYHAHRKANAVAESFPSALILGADTIVYLDYHCFGKPANLAEAHAMLEQLQGRRHQVVTGVCLLQKESGRSKLFCEASEVTFRSVDPPTIDRYLQRIDPLDKAGAYAVQEHGDMLVEEVEGSVNNVIGLPIERLAKELEQWQVSVS